LEGEQLSPLSSITALEPRDNQKKATGERGERPRERIEREKAVNVEILGNAFLKYNNNSIILYNII